MVSSGVKINQESLDAFNELKASRKYRYIILKLSDNLKEIVLDSTGEPTADYEEFRNILIGDEKAPRPRYAFYDVEYTLGADENNRVKNKIVFISWSPDEGVSPRPKMVHASSLNILLTATTGETVVQANSPDDLEWDNLVKAVRR